MTMTTVGYGDILPSNKLEYILCIIMMVHFIISFLDYIKPYFWLYIKHSNEYPTGYL